MKNKFKVGDKIRAKKTANDNYAITNAKNGWEGIVLDDTVVSAFGDILVRTTKPTRRKDNKFIVRSEHFEKIPEECNSKQIYITYDGNKTVTAVLKENGTVKKAVAKCSPEDEFDLYTGADLALKRLFGKDIPKESKDDDKPFEGLAICVGYHDAGFTKNRVYQFKNGHCIDDDGDRRPIVQVPFWKKTDLAMHGLKPFSESLKGVYDGTQI